MSFPKEIKHSRLSREGNKQAQTQFKKLKFNHQKSKAWTLWRLGPPKTGTHTETGQACMRRNTAPAEDHHQHLLDCTTTATPYTATSTALTERERERMKEKKQQKREKRGW